MGYERRVEDWLRAFWDGAVLVFDALGFVADAFEVVGLLF